MLLPSPKYSGTWCAGVGQLFLPEAADISAGKDYNV